MSWRCICISKRAKLELSMGTLVVRANETRRIHLSEVGVLIIESTAVSLTTALLAELIRQKIKVIFCDEYHNPHSELIPYYGAHDSSAQIKKQLSWDVGLKDIIWTEVIHQKIRNQAQHLKVVSKQEAALLFSYLSQVELGDKTNREGHAAKVYFNSLFGTSFTRHDGCTINAALNYGYSILLSLFNREIVSTGAITQIGLRHSNQFNHFNFSSDLMEPFRPFVDKVVYSFGEIEEEFSREMKYELIKIFEENVVLNGNQQKLNYAVKLYVQKVLRVLNESNMDHMPVVSYG